MSLQKHLLFVIQSQGEATLNELYEASGSHKQSYTERELRHLAEGKDAPVKPLRAKNKRGVEYITGYYYV